MRLAAWSFAVCAALCVIGVFLPAAQLQLDGPSVTQRGSLSLYQLSNSEESVRELLAKYRDSTTKKIGARVLGKVAPHLKGRLKSRADDAQDALDTLDAIEDEDVKLVGTITSITMWSLLGLEAMIAVLIFGLTSRSSRLRPIGALIGSLLVAAIGVAILLVLRRVVAEANAELDAELGRSMVSLRAGAYVIPLAAVGTLVAMIALLVAHTRARRSQR